MILFISSICTMQARSHKQEIILVHFRGKELGMALNMVLNLHRLSFEHYLLLTLDESSCQLALKAFPQAGVLGGTWWYHPAGCQSRRHVFRVRFLLRMSPVKLQEERSRTNF